MRRLRVARVKRMDRRAFLASSAAAAATAATAEPALAVYGDSPMSGTVTIAVVAPFTGDQVRLGEQIGNGVRQAVNDANRIRGALDKTYVLRTFDDQNLLATGLVNAEFACDDESVVAVIGHLSGRITEAAMRTYVTNKMPVICPASTYDSLTDHGFGNILRLTTKDSTEGHLAAKHMTAAVSPKTVAVLFQDGDYGFDVANGLVDQLTSDKIKPVSVTISWSKPDWAAAVKTALDPKPDVIFLSGIAKDMGPVIPLLRDAGYTGPLYASQGFFDATIIKKYGAQVDGLVISTSMPPLAIAPEAFRIKNDYEQTYGPLTPLAAFSYAATQIITAIVRRTSAADRLAVARALTYSTSFNTVVGPFTFQNDGDPQTPNLY
ncbi:MAG: branched-chain amino acid ABC transporter substrate-binding protein, partial [Candidatus Eremiobacteraeota bacterium]|nr:branched-chain amino acid ABC transporter substrate-binding protein [Candidatus Eremiobacteraeota bacterium]